MKQKQKTFRIGSLIDAKPEDYIGHYSYKTGELLYHTGKYAGEQETEEEIINETENLSDINQLTLF